MPPMDIDPAHWSTLNRLLDEALDKPASQRAAWVDALGAEFDAVRPPLRALLSAAAAVETADFLNTLPKFSPDAPETSPAGKPGELVGPYRLVRELGSGGMGAVWLAERADGLINRPVALKLPHVIAARAAGLADRMARERDILASLDHRNIARLLDAGITVDGQPFLALEYVEGLPLDRYCDAAAARTQPKLVDLLQLFRQVGGAVAYAHGKLVLHRDLKPANILVTPDGGVKLLDFGIAKLLSDGHASATWLTELSGRALTPDYASPEQILGQPLSVASDVYSLGVVLFEMLTGSKPYRLQRDSRGALEDAIVQGVVPRPSDVAPDSRRTALRGDLDTIVGKALKKLPAERYATVNAMVEDITRYLERRPVLARPDSAGYRLRKFAARNRLAVGAGAVVLAAVSIGAGAAIWQARIAVAQRDRAEAVSDFIASVFEEADPYRQLGRPLTAAELLVRARSVIGTRFATDAPLRFGLSSLVSSSLLGLGDLRAAETAASQTVKDAQQSFGADDERTLRARVQLAEVHAAQRDIGNLRPEVAELLPMTRAAGIPDLQVRMLKASTDLAIEESRYAEGAAPAQEAFELARSQLGETHPLTVAASTLYVEALFFAQAPREKLVSEADRGLALALAVSGGQEASPHVLQMRDVYVRIIAGGGNPRATVQEAGRLIESARMTFGNDSLAVAHAMMNSARDYLKVGEVTTALENSAHALDVLGRHISQDSNEYQYAKANQAIVWVQARQFDAALSSLAAIEEDTRRRLGSTNWDTLSVMLQRAYVLARHGRAEEAQALVDEAVAAGIPDQHRDWSLRMDGAIQRINGHPAKSVDKLREARRLAGESPSIETQYRLAFELGFALLELGDIAGAATEFAIVQGHFDRLQMAMCPVYAELLVAMGRVHLARRDSAAAWRNFSRAAEFWRGFDGTHALARDAEAWRDRAARLRH